MQRLKTETRRAQGVFRSVVQSVAQGRRGCAVEPGAAGGREQHLRAREVTGVLVTFS